MTMTAEARRSQPPPSQGPRSVKMRNWWQRMTADPNAIWMREMRQSARLGRTPWILFSLTLSISLIMCAVGGIAASGDTSPASLGQGLFQGFFSIAYFVVTIVGPAIAANSIASEREGRTWEAVLLTGLTPKEIARGKFLAAYTSIALYVVVLAPVGALSFLFGGVTATEVVTAFAFLFLLAALTVAFGLAVSSLMASLRGAIVLTLILAIVIGPFLYGMFGPFASAGIHSVWNEMPEVSPIWLPLAYERATFGVEYVTLLIVLPLVLIIVPAWFLYETTISNLTGGSDDRSRGLKRWFFVSTPLIAAICAVPSALAEGNSDRSAFACTGISVFAMHVTFCAFLFAFEPHGPSRRVRIHWRQEGAGMIRRFFGPGLMKAMTLVTIMGLFGMAAIAFVDAGLLEIYGPAISGRETEVQKIFLWGAYTALFSVFMIGLVAWLRARDNTPWVSRMIAAAIVFLIAALPWVIVAIGSVAHSGGSTDDDWIVAAAPSPFFAFAMYSALDKIDPGSVIPIGLGCAMAWGFAGLALLAAAGRRCAQSVARYDASLAQAEAAFAAEDEEIARAKLAAAQPAVASNPPPAATAEPAAT
jgi:ABC-type transport system involved in multi-copper enzyme maturation permease subunit